MDMFCLSKLQSGPFLFNDFSLGLQQEQHDECHMWSRNCLPFRNTWVNIWFFVELVLLDLQFRCSFCGFLFVLSFDLYLLITPLVSSNWSYLEQPLRIENRRNVLLYTLRYI